MTTPGLEVAVDAAALPELPATGDQVHLQGTVSTDRGHVVATGAADRPR